MRLTRANEGGLLHDAALGRGGMGWPLLRAEPFGVQSTCKSLIAVKSDCHTGPDSYDPDVATKSSSWSVVQDEGVNATTTGLLGIQPGFPLHAYPAC